MKGGSFRKQTRQLIPQRRSHVCVCLSVTVCCRSPCFLSGMGKKHGDSFKPDILKTSDGRELVYYAVWDSCTRPDEDDLSYTYEQTKTGIRIIANNMRNPRVHYVGTEQRMDRSFKLLIEKDDGKLDVMDAKFYRFKPVVQPSDEEKPVLSAAENREELMKFTSKRMQKQETARKKRAIGVGVDDAMKLKKVKFAESNIKHKPDDPKKMTNDDTETADQKPKPLIADEVIDYTRSVDDLIGDLLNQNAKSTADLFNPDLLMPPVIAKRLKIYVKTAKPESLYCPQFQELFAKCTSDEDKALTVYADTLVAISKISFGKVYADDPLEQLSEPQVKNEMLKRFTEQTTAGSSNTRHRLKWLITEKSKDLMTAIVMIVMYKLANKKYMPVNSVTKLLSSSAKKVTRVATIMNCGVDRSSKEPEIYFQLPKEKTDNQNGKKLSGRPKK